MINIKENGLVNARELHSTLEIKTRFNDWFNRVATVCGFEDGKEFYSFQSKTFSTQGGGRPTQEYDITIDAAKEACIVGESKKSSEVRKYLISLSNQKDSGDLLTHDQVLYLTKLKEVFKYLSNCSKAKDEHEEKFVSESISFSPYAEFNGYRNSVLNLGKADLDKRLKEYCIENHRLVSAKMNQQDKLALLDKYDVLRNGVWDFLMASGADKQAMKLANLVKDMARIDNSPIYRKNEDTLFDKRDTISIDDIKNKFL